MTSPNDDELIERLNKLLPVSWDNELDGHGEPTHAVLTFGEHQTQAITLCPDDWMALNNLASRLTELTRALDEIMAEYRKYGATGIDVMFEIAKTARGFEPSIQRSSREQAKA